MERNRNGGQGGKPNEIPSAFVAFDVNALVMDIWGYEDEGPAQEVAESSAQVVREALEETLGDSVPITLTGQPYRGGAGLPDLIYLLDQIRPWLGTAADLIALGLIAKAIVEKAAAKFGGRGEYVYFSQRLIEAMCVHSLHERAALNADDLLVRSEGFQMWRTRGSRADAPGRDQIYLVWVSTGGQSFQLLIDSSGSVWAAYRVNQDTTEVERLGPPLTCTAHDT